MELGPGLSALWEKSLKLASVDIALGGHISINLDLLKGYRDGRRFPRPRLGSRDRIRKCNLQ